MQISTDTQTLNSNSVPQELRSRDALRLRAALETVPAEQELKSDRTFINRDRVTLSAEAAQISRLADSASELKTSESGLVGLETEEGEFVGLDSSSSSVAARADSDQQELEITRELAERDREVRAHEQAHAAIGGQYASAPSYSYERGPDGRLYAVEGEVKIDTSPIPNDPEATLEKAEIIQRAALSVAEPSSADRAAAAEARAMAIEARAQLLQQEETLRSEELVAETEKDEAEADDDRPTAGEQLQSFRDERAARAEGAAEALNEFNNRLNEINKQLAEINKKLVDAGVFQKLFPEGSLLDQQV
ncbi:putative metalloprotease CJM1_0395 family protein [uncultured Neptuniibacter sp.]|uniref:putative metalloprotease CJM1_0395 family protein n=1 Tax=uncultured Neptuniibacter sp. TaxID=502143 RepID=UPI0026126849|nr:putative metalloprotease CJM1_0395 family protein [uncultured Neptuniibacter sp.]